ncbi:MAG: FtsW/RodA/SpoVE family cell cycle protein [Anaerolineales bacterium]
MTVSAQPADTRKTSRARARPASFDWALLLTTGALVAFGLMMVYSTTFDWSYRVYGSPTTIFMRQVTSLGLGLAAMFILARLDYHFLQRPWIAITIILGTIGLLIVVQVAGSTVFGAKRGIFEGRYQPSELAKLTVIIYLSVWLASRREHLRNVGYGMLPYAVIVGVVSGLILLQPDLSAVLTIVLVGGTLFLLAGAELLQVGIVGIISAAVASAVIAWSDTGRDRLSVYLNGLNDLTQASWHVQQAIVAFVNGGWFGRGLGESYQKFSILPTPHTDSIFAIVAEELGLAGSLVLIVLFAVLIWRGIKIAANAPDFFGAILAGGLSSWLAYEAIINIAVMVAALPFAGNALPFISYGGSSLVVALSAIGILLSISRHDPADYPKRKTRAAVDLRRRGNVARRRPARQR